MPVFQIPQARLESKEADMLVNAFMGLQSPIKHENLQLCQS